VFNNFLFHILNIAKFGKNIFMGNCHLNNITKLKKETCCNMVRFKQLNGQIIVLFFKNTCQKLGYFLNFPKDFLFLI